MSSKIDPNSLGFLLTDVARMLRAEFERRISGAGLEVTPGEARALLHIAARPGYRQNALAELMGIEPMTFCRYVDRLESLDLVERTPDPADRRAKQVAATPKGDAMVGTIRDYSRLLVEDVQTGLEGAERAVLRQALLTIRENLGSPSERSDKSE